MVNNCANCDKDGCTKRCGECKSSFYCSRECQVAHWNKHKSSCKILTRGQKLKEETGGGVGEAYVRAGAAGLLDQDPQYLDPMAMAKMVDALSYVTGETRDVSAEYRKAYPQELQQYIRVKREETTYKSSRQYETLFSGKKEVFGDEDFSKNCHWKRWAHVLDTEHVRLIEFLSSPHRKEGDLFKRKIISPYPSETFQTMKNISTLDQIYESGRNYVSIGYVDLSPLLWGIYHDEEYDNPIHFYGYEANLVVALRSKIVLELLKMERAEVSIESILQIWFSSCLDPEAIGALYKVLIKMKKSASQLNLAQEELKIIDMWEGKKISARKAKDYFSANLSNSNFCGVWSMSNETDRVRFLRYLFTGCIFVDEDQVKSGNPTMFTQLNGFRKNIAFENFFKSVNLQSNHLSKPTKNSLFEEITFVTQNAAQQLRKRIQEGMLICHLHHKNVKMDDALFVESVRELEPYFVDWSNVPDYLEKNSFIELARSMSTEHTIHRVTFINWIHYVFGSVHVDWHRSRDMLEKLYHTVKTKKTHSLKQVSAIFGKVGIYKYFDMDTYVNPLNEINLFLALRNSEKFENYFLSDENEIPLNRNKEIANYSAMPRLFSQSSSTITAAFSFNRDIDMTIGLTF